MPFSPDLVLSVPEVSAALMSATTVDLIINILYGIKYSKLALTMLLYFPLAIFSKFDAYDAQNLKRVILALTSSDVKLYLMNVVVPFELIDWIEDPTNFNYAVGLILGFFALTSGITIIPDVLELVMVNNLNMNAMTVA